MQETRGIEQIKIKGQPGAPGALNSGYAGSGEGLAGPQGSIIYAVLFLQEAVFVARTRDLPVT